MSNYTEMMPNEDRDFAFWLRQAALDYGAARCCLLNGMFPGFVLAQQATEKLIKAYIRIVDVNWKPKRSDTCLPDVNPSHDLLIYARKADKHFPNLRLEEQHIDTLEKLSKWFEGKYPDGKSHPGNSSTSELAGVDVLLVPLFKDIPIAPEIKVRTGIYPALWSYTGLDERIVFPEHAWLLKENVLLQHYMPPMIDEIRREFMKK